MSERLVTAVGSHVCSYEDQRLHLAIARSGLSKQRQGMTCRTSRCNVWWPIWMTLEVTPSLQLQRTPWMLPANCLLAMKAHGLRLS